MDTEPEIEMKPAWEPTYFFQIGDHGRLVRTLAVIHPFRHYAAETYDPELGYWKLEADDTQAPNDGLRTEEAVERFGVRIVGAPGEAVWPVFEWPSLLSRRAPWLVESIPATQGQLGELVAGAQPGLAFDDDDAALRDEADDLHEVRFGFQTLHSMWRELRIAQWHIKRARIDLGTATEEEIERQVVAWRRRHGIEPIPWP